MQPTLCLALFGCTLWVAASVSPPPKQDLLALPPDFFLGATTSAYQVEGKAGGRGQSVWDYAVHNTTNIADNSNADVACDSYNQYKNDVQLVKNLGFNTYRISISWTRFLPNGTLDNINKEGIQYYNSLIDEIIKNGITPVVTIFHWDVPWKLQLLGGWANPTIIDYYMDYARLVLASFGDRVKHWITFNEPYQVCEYGYSNAQEAPYYNYTGVGGYLCNHNMVLAHARVYRMYKKEFASQKGGIPLRCYCGRWPTKSKMGISIAVTWFEPENQTSQADVQASVRAMEFKLGWSANPIYGKDGDYPSIMRDRVDANSLAEGLTRSRLPTFTSEEIKLTKGAADFLAVNHYTSKMVRDGPPTEPVAVPSLERDSYYNAYNDPTWEGDFDYFKNVPWGFRKALNWIKDRYGNPPVFVAESGIGDLEPLLDDDLRVRYYSGYLKEMLKAIYEDGCNVFGYMAWSLMDNFEWGDGYTAKFGLYHVDFDDPSRPRTPKKSAQWFKTVTSKWRIPEGLESSKARKFSDHF